MINVDKEKLASICQIIIKEYNERVEREATSFIKEYMNQNINKSYLTGKLKQPAKHPSLIDARKAWARKDSALGYSKKEACENSGLKETQIASRLYQQAVLTREPTMQITNDDFEAIRPWIK